jgi:hypothetical protein
MRKIPPRPYFCVRLGSSARHRVPTACAFGGALVGVVLRATLPKEHLTTETQDVVKLGMALIATMTALVLGLLIASAKSTYDTRSNQLLEVSADIILLDRVLAHYGAETQNAREELRRSVVAAFNQFWSPNRDRSLIIDRRAPRWRFSMTRFSNSLPE